MSTVSSQVRARALRPSPLPRPRLTIVPKVAGHAPRIPFVLLVVTVLGAGLVGLLLLNTALQRGAYVVTDLKGQAAQLALQQQNLHVEVADLNQPQMLATRALRLGMVRNDSPAFLSLSSGKVIGAAVPGLATNRVDVGTRVARMGTQGGKISPQTAGAHITGRTEPVMYRPDRLKHATTNAATKSADTPSHVQPR